MMAPEQVEVRQQSMVRRKYKVKGLTELGASQMMFHNDADDTNLSVAAYYEDRYKFKCALGGRLPRATTLGRGADSAPARPALSVWQGVSVEQDCKDPRINATLAITGSPVHELCMHQRGCLSCPAMHASAGRSKCACMPLDSHP